jgi:hypothetical protein
MMRSTPASDRDLHFNDLRETAATKFYIAGFSMREIAETLAWEEGVGREDYPPLCGPLGHAQS